VNEDDPLKPAEFMTRFERVGENVEVYRNALILAPERIAMGDWIRIDDFSRLEGGEGISMGSYLHIESFCSIFGGGRAQLGWFIGIGQGARLITGSGHPFENVLPPSMPESDLWARRRLEVVLGNYTYVGANAVVLPGVHMGEGSVVASGAVVTKDVPPWTIVAGIPAKPVGERAQWKWPIEPTDQPSAATSRSLT